MSGKKWLATTHLLTTHLLTYSPLTNGPMDDIPIEQALWIGTNGRFRLLGRSPGFPDEWLTEAEELCAAFGEPPAGVDCPPCVFAQPFGKHHVAVVQVADQTPKSEVPNSKSEFRSPKSENGDSHSDKDDLLSSDFGFRISNLHLGFRQLVFPRQAYALLGADPFALADRFPPPWDLRGDLPALSTPPTLQARTVEEVQQVLKSPEGPALLGGVQALIDGGRLVFQRPAPDTPLLQNLWMLLPASNRGELWPASFAFGNTLRFDVVVTSRPNSDAYEGYLTEDQAADYPQGRYEFNLQVAAEAGDQAELDVLFSRRSRSQTWCLGWLLIAAMLVLLLVMSLVNSLARH